MECEKCNRNGCYDEYDACPITGEPFPGSPDDYPEEADEQVTFRVTCDAVRNMIDMVREYFPHTIKFDFELSMAGDLDGGQDRPMIIVSCINLETGNILEAYFICTQPKFGEIEES